MLKRRIPESNVCKIKPLSTDSVDGGEYKSHVEAPIRKCLDAVGKDKILYIVFSYQTPFTVILND